METKTRIPRPDETCWTIVGAAAEGDQRAQGQFARIYLEVVRAYLRARWRGRGLIASVDDAVQDVFLECFRSGGALKRVESGRNVAFRTFLFAVVRNVARRHEEREGTRREAAPPSELYMESVPAEEESLFRVVDRAWAQSLLKRAGERQKRWARHGDEAARYRIQLLELRFGEGLPIREIARRWKVDAAGLHAEFRVAREEFKMALREEVTFHNPNSGHAIDEECKRLLALLGQA